LSLSYLKNRKVFVVFRIGYKKIILRGLKYQWQVEKVTQTEPLYILGYTSNLGRVKKRSSKMGKKCRESAENRLKFRIFKYQLLVSIA
jgi:hypothetical protein